MDEELLEPLEPIQTAKSIALENFNALKESDTGAVIQALHNKELLEVANTDEAVKDKITENAKEIIDTEIDTVAKESKLKNQNANFKVNGFACTIYGVEETCPIWQQRLMKIGAGFWFVIYWLIASLTIVPLNTFLKMIGNIIKNNIGKWLLAILFYFIVLFVAIATPILINYIGKI